MDGIKELLEKMQFKSERLGNVMSGAHRMEPILRDADLVSFDASSIRASDHAAHSDHGRWHDGHACDKHGVWAVAMPPGPWGQLRGALGHFPGSCGLNTAIFRKMTVTVLKITP